MVIGLGDATARSSRIAPGVRHKSIDFGHGWRVLSGRQSQACDKGTVVWMCSVALVLCYWMRLVVG